MCVCACLEITSELDHVFIKVVCHFSYVFICPIGPTRPLRNPPN
jgi:hypothetical protein